MSTFDFTVSESPVQPPAADAASTGDLQKITDHAARALARLPSRFYGKPNITMLLNALSAEIQELEDVGYALYIGRRIDSAIGAQLDVLGRIVGEAREGASDSIYRRYIRARIAVNNSEGTIPNVITVARLVLDSAATTLAITSGGAAMTVTMGTTDLGDDVAAVLLEYLKETVLGGVRLLLYNGVVDADAFTFGGVGVATAESNPIGAAQMTITTGIEDFPASGTILIAPGEATEAEHTYTAISGNSFTGLSPVLADAHNNSQVIEVDEDTGMGDTADALVGGDLWSVLE